MTDFDVESWRSKIAKLLAKAESSTHPAERDAFMAKAEQMMLRLGIERAELEAVGDATKEQIVEVQREWRGNYSIVMVPFVQSVSIGFGGLQIFQATYSATRRWTYIVGPKSQVDEFLLLIDSLHIQVMAALKAFQRETVEERRYMTDMEKYVQHRSFISGFGDEVRRRLQKMRNQEEATMSTGAALVLVDRKNDIDEWVSTNYGRTSKARGGIQNSSYTGTAAGARAGQKATLNQKGVGSTQSALR